MKMMAVVLEFGGRDVGEGTDDEDLVTDGADIGVILRLDGGRVEKPF